MTYNASLKCTTPTLALTGKWYRPTDNTPFQTTLLTTITWELVPEGATDSDTCVLVDRLVQDNGAIMTYTHTV